MNTTSAPTNATNHGTIVSIRGSVVDVRFENRLPSINSVLHTGLQHQVVIEVLTQLDEHRVRGIALTPTQGLARGMTVLDTGGPLKAPVGKEILSRMFDVFGNVIDRGAALKQQSTQRDYCTDPAIPGFRLWDP